MRIRGGVPCAFKGASHAHGQPLPMRMERRVRGVQRGILAQITDLLAAARLQSSESGKAESAQVHTIVLAAHLCDA